MVHLYGVAKFVEEDVVDQVPGQEHQGKREIDAATWCATTPMAFAVEDFYIRAGEAVPGGRSSNREGKRRRAHAGGLAQ